MKREITKAQQAALENLRAGEAIMQTPYFSRGGLNIMDVIIAERLAAKGYVKIEAVGRSVFASITDAGRDALVRAGKGER